MIDLHLHLDGSLTAGALLTLAKHDNIPLPCQDEAALLPLLQAEPDCPSLGVYLEKFDLPLQVLQREYAIENGVYFLLKRLAEQGLCYAEIRFAPQLHLQKGLTQEQVVFAAVRGLEKGIAEFGILAQLILCCMRMDSNEEENLETVRAAKSFLGKGVCAVDLAGNEAGFPTKKFTEVFSLAKALNVPFTLHAGEAAGAESVQEALDLGACRIGHGIRSVERDDLMTRLAQEKIPLELCYTSNLQTKAVTDAADYPICRFLERGIPVTVNTDNMTVSGTDLRREYTLLQAHFQLPDDTLLTLACNAADATFLPTGQKTQLKEQIRKKFVHWLKDPDV